MKCKDCEAFLVYKKSTGLCAEQPRVDDNGKLSYVMVAKGQECILGKENKNEEKRKRFGERSK